MLLRKLRRFNLVSWRRKCEKSDAVAVATAEVGVVFNTVVLVTGPLWAKPVWGIWWTWDARLTSTFIMWLIYISYLLLRRFSTANEQTPKLAAALAIFGFVDVPIVYMSIRWWRTQHPSPVIGGGENSGLDPHMLHALLWNFAAFAAYGLLSGLAALPTGARTPAVEYALSHARSCLMPRNLIIAYIATWAIHIGYLVIVSSGFRKLAKEYASCGRKRKSDMRRILGAVLMLAGAYALYWAWQGAGGKMPSDFSFTNPVIQYGVCGALAFFSGLGGVSQLPEANGEHHGLPELQQDLAKGPPRMSFLQRAEQYVLSVQ